MNELEKIISCMFCGKTKDKVNKLFISKNVIVKIHWSVTQQNPKIT